MTHRWSKFWWQDWQRDPALRACSIAARGLWIEMLAIAHEGAPRGHVTINSKPASPKQIARVAGISERECEKLLAELEDNGVFSRTDTGTIYSRRMVRDTEASEMGKALGATGGNPALKAAKSKPHNPGGGGEGLTPPFKLQEADIKKEKVPTTSDGVPPSPPEPDARTALFKTGLATYRDLTGRSEAQARQRIGQLLRTARDDAARVNAALAEAADLRPADPEAWLSRAVQPAARTNPQAEMLMAVFGGPIQ